MLKVRISAGQALNLLLLFLARRMMPCYILIELSKYTDAFHHEQELIVMQWVNRSLFNKLLSIITGGCLLILIAGGYYFQRVNHSINQYNQLIASEIAIERQISLMSNEFKTQIQEWKNVLLRGQDPAQLDRYWTSFQTQERRVQEIGTNVLPLMTEGPEK